MLRHVNAVTGASPFESMMVADIGDMGVVPFNVERSCRIIKEETANIIKDGCRPLSMGGDHLVSYPVLQAMKV
jgi:arginase family enzyme